VSVDVGRGRESHVVCAETDQAPRGPRTTALSKACSNQPRLRSPRRGAHVQRATPATGPSLPEATFRLRRFARGSVRRSDLRPRPHTSLHLLLQVSRAFLARCVLQSGDREAQANGGPSENAWRYRGQVTGERNLVASRFISCPRRLVPPARRCAPSPRHRADRAPPGKARWPCPRRLE
jgi:hypothetical protein